jgi:hypothetical protein
MFWMPWMSIVSSLGGTWKLVLRLRKRATFGASASILSCAIYYIHPNSPVCLIRFVFACLD